MLRLALAAGIVAWLAYRPPSPVPHTSSVRRCALAIPPAQVSHRAELDLVYLDQAQLRPGWLVVVGPFACD